jgi:hypothetical protein
VKEQGKLDVESNLMAHEVVPLGEAKQEAGSVESGRVIAADLLPVYVCLDRALLKFATFLHML